LPAADVSITPPAVAQKIPMKVAVVVDDNYTADKTENLGGGMTETLTVPFGYLVKKASLDVLPYVFEKVVFVHGQSYPPDIDAIYTPAIKDFTWSKKDETPFLSFTPKIKFGASVSLRSALTDLKGIAIWEKITNSPVATRMLTGMSSEQWLKWQGEAFAEAVAEAMKEASKEMISSREIYAYATSKGKHEEYPAAQQFPVSKPVSPVSEEGLPPSRPDTYAIVIGIDYKSRDDIPNLQYASNDAKKVYSILTDPRYGGVPKENAVLLINEKATRNEMIAALRKIKNWDGYVYVYYSGHGAPKTKGDKFIDAFLVPNDAVITDPEAMEDTSIKVSYLQELVETSNAKGVMLALDACFSGGGKSIVPKGGKPLVGMIVSPELIKTKGTGKVIITSSATNQQSWEDETELKGGIFSHYLLEGLKGKASKGIWVKVDELAEYIKDNVTKAARKLKGQEQTPQITGKADFAVTRNWEKAKVMDIEIAKNKLKTAFEKGYITAEQLSKALDELKTPKHSKTLDAFLEGKIDEKKFGELY
jgi:hypothetical protein